MKLRNFILILFLLAIGCQTMPAEEKVKRHLIRLECVVRDKITSKMLGEVEFGIYNMPDTVYTQKKSGGWDAELGANDKFQLPLGKYIARVYKVKWEGLEDFKEVAPGVFSGSPNIIETDEYDPQWIEFEITEKDVDNGVKSLGTVYLEKKRKFSVPKPAEVKRSKS